MFGIHSSSIPLDFFVPVCSRVFYQVDSVLVFCSAVIFIPGNLVAWDESAWNVSRDGSIDASITSNPKLDTWVLNAHCLDYSLERQCVKGTLAQPRTKEMAHLQLCFMHPLVIVWQRRITIV